MAHAKFSPSAAHRWMECPAALAMEGDLPNKSSEYADEGTAAHTLLSTCLLDGSDATMHVGEMIKAGERSFVVDESMAGYIQVVIDHVRRLTLAGWTLLVEQRVEFSDAIAVPDQFGTADIILISPDGKEWRVEDLKYGRGVKVYAENNQQALTYAVGTLETFGIAYDPPERVTVCIHQPRLDHLDEYTTGMDGLREHAVAMKHAAYSAQEAIAQRSNFGVDKISAAYFNPGEKTCQWCKAKANCPGLARKVAAEVYEDMTAFDTPEQVIISGAPPPQLRARIGALFGVLGLVEDWCRAVRAEAERLVMAGEEVIGPDGLKMKVVAGRSGNRAWIDAATAEGVLLGLLPPEKAYKPKEIITPSAADKLLNKKKTAQLWEQVKTLYHQPPGRPSVVLGSDPRPSYSPEATDDEFEKLDADISA